MLQQKRDKALMRAQGRAMDDVRILLQPIVICVDEIEAGRHSKVELVGVQRKFPADHRAELEVHLGTIEGALAFGDDVVEVELIERLAQHVFAEGPGLRVVDILAAALGIFRIPEAQPQVVVLKAEELVVVAVQLHYRLELGFQLLGRDVQVRIVHRHTAHARQALQLAGALITVDRAILAEPKREVAVRSSFGSEDHVVVRAVHRLQIVAFLGRAPRLLHQLHGRKHGLFVERDMA